MSYVHLVIIAALAQYLWFGRQVSVMRGRHGIAAPATSGHPEFERMFRVQQNTLELLVVWLPCMLLAPLYAAPWRVAVVGAIFIVGREVYRRLYLADPKKRGMGYGLSASSYLILMFVIALGAVRQLLG